MLYTVEKNMKYNIIEEKQQQYDQEVSIICSWDDQKPIHIVERVLSMMYDCEPLYWYLPM